MEDPLKPMMPWNFRVLVGKLFLVDLAGSERLKKSGKQNALYIDLITLLPNECQNLQQI